MVFNGLLSGFFDGGLMATQSSPTLAKKGQSYTRESKKKTFLSPSVVKRS